MPIFFAEQAARTSTGTSNADAQQYAVEGAGQGQPVSHDPPSNSTASFTTSNSRQSSQYTDYFTKRDPSLKQKKRIVGYSTANNNRELTSSPLFVFLGIRLGDENRLAQIEIIDKKDDTFYEELKRSYKATKGILRRVLGIWKYAHCEFLKVPISLPPRSPAEGRSSKNSTIMTSHPEHSAFPLPRI